MEALGGGPQHVLEATARNRCRAAPAAAWPHAGPHCSICYSADEPKTPYLSPMDTDEEGDLGDFFRSPGSQPACLPPLMLLLWLPAAKPLCPCVSCHPAGSCMRPLALEDAATAAAAAVAATADMSSAPSGGTTSDDGGPLALGRGRCACLIPIWPSACMQASMCARLQKAISHRQFAT